MRGELSAGKAWAGIAAGVIAYELAAPEGELLSEGVDRAMEHSSLARAAVYAAIGCTALHLINMIPERVDPFHQLLKFTKHKGIDNSSAV
jgi:hypothetical protein